MKNELINKYFEWMYHLACDEKYTRGKSYRQLLQQLHDTEFIYILDIDENRARDGFDLRYRFGYFQKVEPYEIIEYFNDMYCSILEMMLALAIRCEEHIMDNPDIGDQTGKWFMDMIASMGLDTMDDENFNEDYTEQVLHRFLNREYRRNGQGGLFTVHHHKEDMRLVEIWYQAMWYLDEVLKR